MTSEGHLLAQSGPGKRGRDARVRVAAVMDTAIVSGPGRQLAALVHPLEDHGVDLHPVVFQNPTLEKTAYRRYLEDAGIDHTVVPFTSRLDRGLVRGFRGAIASLDPDIVQTHSYRPTTLTWLLRRSQPPWRWIAFFHGTTNEDLKVRVYHWLDRQLMPGADRVVVMSWSQADRFSRCADRVIQIYNAVIPVPPSGTFAETSEIYDRVRRLPRPRIGVIGRLSEEKGVDVMLDAMIRIAHRVPEASLLIAGDGPERSTLEARAERTGVADRVVFLGSVLPVEPLYSCLDLVVLPSRSEGLPNVLLEALRADIPVVATRVGAVPDVLEGTGAGRMVASEDPEGLAEAVVATLAEPAESRAPARARVVSRFSLEQRIAAHVRLYDGVLPAARSRVA